MSTDIESEIELWFQQLYVRHVPERSKNRIEFREHSVIKKSEDLTGEIWWYQHIPIQISSYFPNLLQVHPPTQYEIELINGTSLSYLYLEEKMTSDMLLKLLNVIEEIHAVNVTSELSENPEQVDLSYNYLNKLSDRYHKYDYSIFPRANLTFQRIFEYFENYIHLIRLTPAVIHGDPVFSNILITPNLELKFVDMRGKIGSELTLIGDKWYDYGKIYQSLIGYDEILLETHINPEYGLKLQQCFEDFVIAKWGQQRMKDIKWITASHIFSLIPLHANDKCHQYYKLIEKLIPLM